MMMRVLAILMLILAGLPRLDAALSRMDHGLMATGRSHTQCVELACAPVPITPGCCIESSPIPETVPQTESVCPMSNGPCRCGVSPSDGQPIAPKAPLQRSESQLTLGLASHQSGIHTWTPIHSGITRPTSTIVWGLGSLRTHNEIQAYLGIWRT